VSEYKEFDEMFDKICDGMSSEEKESLRRELKDIIASFVSKGESELDLIRRAKEVFTKIEGIIIDLSKD